MLGFCSSAACRDDALYALELCIRSRHASIIRSTLWCVTEEIRMRFDKQPTGRRIVRLLACLAMLAMPALGWTAAGQDKIVKAYLEAAASGQPEALLQFF